MGQPSNKRIIVTIIVFISISILIRLQVARPPYLKKPSLQEAIANIQGWKTYESIGLDQNVLKALSLDDYLNQNYSNGEVDVSLYVGYYRTTKKVGLSHSPLVCFPGQGWIVSESTDSSMKIADKTINYATMIVSKGESKNLIVYWFQAAEKTSPGTFFQKINLFLVKYLHSRQSNAFVRISIPMNGRTKEESLKESQKFIRDFYPIFLEYVTDQL